MDGKNFYTLKGYEQMNPPELSPAMEDYLEMIYRHLKEEPYIRVNQLAARLNVKPSSASKMAAKLTENGYLSFEHYGLIRLTNKGVEMGEYLYWRHGLVNAFFCFINQSENELELTERVEHFIDKKTALNLAAFLEQHQAYE